MASGRLSSFNLPWVPLSHYSKSRLLLGLRLLFLLAFVRTYSGHPWAKPTGSIWISCISDLEVLKQKKNRARRCGTAPAKEPEVRT